MWDVCQINTYTYNMDMHDIHPCAYRICTVHMRYAHGCICMYEHISVCIGFSMSCILCIWVCMFWKGRVHTAWYSQICTYEEVHICMYLNVFWGYIPADMHSFWYAYLFVSDCILCLYTFRYAHVVMCISECIWMYFAATIMHICTLHDVHMFLYLTVCFFGIHAHTSKWVGGFIAPNRPSAGAWKSAGWPRAA